MAVRKIVFFGDYFEKAYRQWEASAKLKCDYILKLIAELERIPAKFIKKMEGSEGIYEIRITEGGSSIRIFCLFDENNMIVLLNAFQKKSRKTPKNELVLAENLRQRYLLEK